MKRAIHLLVILTLNVALIGCGKKEAAKVGAETLTLGEQLETLTVSNRTIARRSSDDAISLSAENLLNGLYGSNASVTRVVIAGVGFTGRPVGRANLVIYDKDASGVFQLTSGNPTRIQGLNPATLALFAATGVVPLAAGGAGFCAGGNGQTVQSGAFALGVGYQVSRGTLAGIAGIVFKAGNQYQACSNYGCTPVTTIPAIYQQLFPSCFSLMQ